MMDKIHNLDNIVVGDIVDKVIEVDMADMDYEGFVVDIGHKDP